MTREMQASSISSRPHQVEPLANGNLSEKMIRTKSSIHNKAIATDDTNNMNHIHEDDYMRVHQISGEIGDEDRIESDASTIMYQDEETPPPSQIRTDQDQEDYGQDHREQELQEYSNSWRRRHAGHLLIIMLFWCGQKYILPPFCNLIDMLDGMYLDRNDDLFLSLDG